MLMEIGSSTDAKRASSSLTLGFGSFNSRALQSSSIGASIITNTILVVYDYGIMGPKTYSNY